MCLHYGRPGPDLDPLPFAFRPSPQARSMSCILTEAQTWAPSDAVTPGMNSGGAGTFASQNFVCCASGSSLQVKDSRNPRQAAPTRAPMSRVFSWAGAPAC